MSAVDEFLRRFAASPIHVPQLERVLDTFGGTSPAAFAAAFIEWDREAAHPEAARIALELLVPGYTDEDPPWHVGMAELRDAILSVPAGAVAVRALLRERLAAASASPDDGPRP
jgi:hypothetical protein